MARKNSYTSDIARRLGFRSGFESDLAADLDEKGIPYEYESEKCKIVWFENIRNGECLTCKGNSVVQKHIYTCDFLFTKKNGQLMFVETKGRFTSKDRSKHAAIKKQYPDLDLRILFSYNGKATPTQSNLQWCSERGIVAATVIKNTRTRKGRYLPTAWIKEIK